MVSDIPFNGPIAGVRVGRVDGQARSPTPPRKQRERVGHRPRRGVQHGGHRDGRGRRERGHRGGHGRRARVRPQARASRSSSSRTRCARELGVTGRDVRQDRRGTTRRSRRKVRDAGRGTASRPATRIAEKHDALRRALDRRRRRSLAKLKERAGRDATPPRSRSRPRRSTRTSSTSTCATLTVSGGRIGGRPHDEVRDITCEVGVLPAHPRLGALHPRRDAGAGGRHARHRRRRAAHRAAHRA